VIDSLPMLPAVVGSWDTPGGAFDAEIRGEGSTATLVVADGASGLAVADLAIGSGAPATVTFTPRAATPLPGNWGTAYARDVAWLPLSGSADYAVAAAGAGGVHVVRIPPSGAATVVLAQETAGAPCGIATTWPGIVAAAHVASGITLLQTPGASQLDLVTGAATPPYTAPVVLSRNGSWPGGGALEQASFASPAGGATSLAFGTGGAPVPEIFVSDRSRVLVLRPGSLTITAVASDPPRTPPLRGRILLDVTPNPSTGSCVVRARALVSDTTFGSDLLRPNTRIEIVDVRGRIVRVLSGPVGPPGRELRRTWDGRDGQGRRVASGRYWARVQTTNLLVGAVTALVIVR